VPTSAPGGPTRIRCGAQSREVGSYGLAHGLRIPVDHGAMGEDRTGNGTPSGTPSGTDRASDRDTYYTVTEAAKVLGITGRRVRALAQEGRIEGERLEGGWKLFRSSVHAFRDERRDREVTSAVRESFLTTSELLDRVSCPREGVGARRGPPGAHRAGRVDRPTRARPSPEGPRRRALRTTSAGRTPRRGTAALVAAVVRGVSPGRRPWEARYPWVTAPRL
jgi:excisionase family DNA binding protein